MMLSGATTKLGIVHPFTLVGAMVIYSCAFKLAYLVWCDCEPIDANSLLLAGILIAFFFIIALMVYGLAPRFPMVRILAVQPEFVNNSRIRLLATVVGLFSVAAFVVCVLQLGILSGSEAVSAKRFLGDGDAPSGRFSTSIFLWFKLAQLSRISAILYFIYYLRTGNRTALAGVAFTATIYAGLSVAFSNRAGILLISIDLVVVLVAFGKNISAPKMLKWVAVAIALLMLSTELRTTDALYQKSLLAHLFGGFYFIDIYRVNLLMEHFSFGGGAFLLGQSFIGWLYLLLPGDWELAKSYSNLGWTLGASVFGRQASGVPPGFIAEAFINFGWAGVAAGGAFFGWASCYCTRNWYGHTVFWRLVLCMIAVRLSLTMFNHTFGSFALKLGSEVVPIILLTVLAGGAKFVTNTKK